MPERFLWRAPALRLKRYWGAETETRNPWRRGEFNRQKQLLAENWTRPARWWMGWAGLRTRNAHPLQEKPFPQRSSHPVTMLRQSDMRNCSILNVLIDQRTRSAGVIVTPFSINGSARCLGVRPCPEINMSNSSPICSSVSITHSTWPAPTIFNQAAVVRDTLP